MQAALFGLQAFLSTAQNADIAQSGADLPPRLLPQEVQVAEALRRAAPCLTAPLSVNALNALLRLLLTGEQVVAGEAAAVPRLHGALLGFGASLLKPLDPELLP